MSNLNEIFEKDNDISRSLVGDVGFVLEALSHSAGGFINDIGSSISTIFKGGEAGVKLAIEGMGEGSADLLGNSIGNIFKTFVSPVLNVIQWILIILIIIYLIKLRGERNMDNVMVKSRWNTTNNLST